MAAQSVLDCTVVRWVHRMGDPTILAWFTVLLYAIASIMCLRAARGVQAERQAGDPVARREWMFWTGAAVLLALYAINKQLDGQIFVTALGRCTAKAQGWYDHRQKLQIAFIVIFALGSVTALNVIRRWLTGTLRRTGIAAFGLVFITGFILIRAVGFQHVDKLLHFRVGGIRANLLLEIPGPLLVSVGAALSRIRSRA